MQNCSETIRVLVIAPRYPSECDVISQNHVHNQLLSYPGAGLAATALDLHGDRGPVRREIYESVPVIRLGMQAGGMLRGPLFRARFRARLARLLREIIDDFDVVHIHCAPVQLLDVMPIVAVRAVVFTCHGDEVYVSRNPLLERQRHALLAYADRVVGVSEYTTALAAHYLEDRRKAVFVPNGVREDLFRAVNEISPVQARKELDLPRDGRIVFMACSLIERKGVLHVVRAFAEVCDTVENAFLVVVGKGDQEEAMREIVRERGLEHRVRMIGYVADDATMAKLYRASDLYVMCSRTVENDMGAGVEGFGISYIDANAVGIPVVGGRSGGVESAVIDGVTGFLVDPEAAEVSSQLRARIVQLLSDDTLRVKMGRAGQERVFGGLTWGENVKRIRGIYESVLRGNGRAERTPARRAETR